MWHLFSWHAWTAEILVFSLPNKDSSCVFSSLSSLAWQPHPLQPWGMQHNRLITTTPIFVASPWPLTSISSADSSYCFLHSSGGFIPSPAETMMHSPRLCVTTIWRLPLRVWDYTAGQRIRAPQNTTPTRHSTLWLLHFPRLTANNSQHDISSQRWGKVQVLLCSQVRGVTHRGYHSHSKRSGDHKEPWR